MNPLRRRNILKKIINSTTRKFVYLVPEVEKTTKISKLTQEVFYTLLLNISHQPEKYYKDKNFPRLLETTRKMLIFLTETDNHYEKWVGYFYIQVMLKMNRLYEQWQKGDYGHLPAATFQDFADWFLETEVSK